jgi:hypothetical protein
VNAANGRLDHASGLAGAISKKGLWRGKFRMNYYSFDNNDEVNWGSWELRVCPFLFISILFYFLFSLFI